MRIPRRRRANGDEGLAIVFIALMLVVLMIFASFAVDLGGLFAARRQDQNAADTGALGGAQDFQNQSSIVTDVDNLVSNTLGISTGTMNWSTGCPNSNTDTDNVDTAVPGTTQGSSCITKDGTGRFLQVRLPVRQYQTMFGRVVGLGSFDHTAFAIAGTREVGFGGVLPYALVASAGAGDGYNCIKVGGGNVGNPLCDNNSSGNFGFFDFGFFGNTDLGTTLDCGSGGQSTRKINNTGAGVDHDLSRYGVGQQPWGAAEVIDAPNACAANPQQQSPNSIDSITGNTPNEFGTAMYSGSAAVFTDGKPARLARTDPSLPSPATTQNIGGHQLDNNPLWSFITPGLDPTTTDVPSSCEKNQFTGPDGTFGTSDDLDSLPQAVKSHLATTPQADRVVKLLQRCFTHYNGGFGSLWNDGGSWTASTDVNNDCQIGGSNACTGVVFGRNLSASDSPDLFDIQYTSRFGYVPQLLETTVSSGGSGVYHIATFRAIFLQRLYAGTCNAANGCNHTFDPGIACNCTSSASDASAVTAFVFPRTMLPNNLASDSAPFDIGKNRFIQLVR